MYLVSTINNAELTQLLNFLRRPETLELEVSFISKDELIAILSFDDKLEAIVIDTMIGVNYEHQGQPLHNQKGQSLSDIVANRDWDEYTKFFETFTSGSVKEAIMYGHRYIIPFNFMNCRVERCDYYFTGELIGIKHPQALATLLLGCLKGIDKDSLTKSLLSRGYKPFKDYPLDYVVDNVTNRALWSNWEAFKSCVSNLLTEGE